MSTSGPLMSGAPGPSLSFGTTTLNGITRASLAGLVDGDVVSAVRASSARPGMFLPVMIDGRVLADGDIVAPVPAATAKKLGAVKVLAVDVSAFADTTPPVEAMTVDWVERDVRRRNMIDSELRATDAVIRVRLTYYSGAWNDGRVAAIAAGREAAQAALPALRRHGPIPLRP